MAKSLQEYVNWLDERDLIWPQPPKPVSVNAVPYLKPLAGIRAVTWSVYGTLLRISGGRLLHDHPEELRMQIALEKTIREFNVWHSMTRKPGEPWKQLYVEYKSVLDKMRLTSSPPKGDVPEVNSAKIWQTIVKRLEAKEYEYDRAFYGDREALSEKIAYFFHANLQGTEAAPHALLTLSALSQAGLTQTLLADAQPFTFVQMLRAIREQGTLAAPGSVFAGDCLTLSFREGVRKPSRSLYRECLVRLGLNGISPGETLHVSSRLRDDLAVAREFGMRTALYAADDNGFQATKSEVRDPKLRPDRLLTDLHQLREILQTG